MGQLPQWPVVNQPSEVIAAWLLLSHNPLGRLAPVAQRVMLPVELIL